jgi:hypothetical protein
MIDPQIVEIDYIRINIETNIPNKNVGKNMYLRRDMIYSPNLQKSQRQNQNEYPLFSSTRKFPKDFLIRRKYEEQLEFFFNVVVFEKVMRQNTTYSEPSDEIMRYNINTLIELLFTTVYPIINDNTESFTKYILGKNNNILSLKGSIPSPLNKLFPHLEAKFTYLKLDNKIYTVTSTCILNDLLNHPEYQQMLLNVQELEGLRKSIQYKITTRSEKIDNELYKIIKNKLYHLNSSYIMKELSKKKEDSRNYKIKKYPYDFEEEYPVKGDVLKYRKELQEFNERYNEFKHKKKDYERESYINSKIMYLDNKEKYSGQLFEIFVNFVDEFDKKEEIQSPIYLRVSKKDKNQIYKKMYSIILDCETNYTNIFGEQYQYRYYNNYEGSSIFFTELSKYLNEQINLQEIKDITLYGNKNVSILDAKKKKEFQRYFDDLFNEESKFIIRKISNHSSSFKKSSNVFLQKIIDDFVNKENSLLSSLVEYVNKRYINGDKNIQFPENVQTLYNIDAQNALYVGLNTYFISNRERPKYDAYVFLNVIGGEINQDVLKSITCDFKNEQLGKTFQQLNFKKGYSNIDKYEFYDIGLFTKDTEVVKQKIGGRNKRQKKIVCTSTTKKNKKKISIFNKGAKTYTRHRKRIERLR